MHNLELIIDNDTEYILSERIQNVREMILESPSIYWFFKNILTGVNDRVLDADTGTQIIRFTDGYYNIRDIQREFKSKKIELISNMHNSTCYIKSQEKNLKMGKLGVMLGFAEDKVITKNKWEYPTGEVQLNHGLEYIRISADIVDSKYMHNEKGERSDIIGCLPIDITQPLFGTLHTYEYFRARVPILSSFSSIRFRITTNIDWPVEVKALIRPTII